MDIHRGGSLYIGPFSFVLLRMVMMMHGDGVAAKAELTAMKTRCGRERAVLRCMCIENNQNLLILFTLDCPLCCLIPREIMGPTFLHVSIGRGNENDSTYIYILYTYPEFRIFWLLFPFGKREHGRFRGSTRGAMGEQLAKATHFKLNDILSKLLPNYDSNCFWFSRIRLAI